MQIRWTGGVDPAEVDAVEAGVNQVLEYLADPLELDTIGPDADLELWQSRCLKDTDSGYGQQVDADCILVGQLPYAVVTYAKAAGQTPPAVSRLTVVTLKADLTEAEANFVFGAGRAGLGAVLSVARFRDIEDRRLRSRVLRRLAAHETGHALGLVPDDRKTNVASELGLHCTNLCLMRQGLSLTEFVELTEEEDRARVGFCSACAEYLAGPVKNLEILFGRRLWDSAC